MRNEEMKKFAVREWEWIVANWDYSQHPIHNHKKLRRENPDLAQFEFHSAFCDEFFASKCAGCPLRGNGYPGENVCCDEYYSWCGKVDAKEDGGKQAEAMLEKIRSL